jgi:glycosyltransferase involved in cell wall biosynthesis
VFVSDALRQAFQPLGRFRHAQTQVVHNGIDMELFRPTSDRSFRNELGISEREVLVGAVGNIRVSKAYPMLLQAAALLKQRGTGCRIVIVGQGDDSLHDEVLALRHQLGLEQDVILAGFRGDIAQVMNSLDLYVLSSSAEGFSLTTVQAMACGVPVVATRCGGPEEIVDDGITGRLVPPNSPGALADAIEALVSDSALRARLGPAGRAVVERKFSLQSMVNGYAGIYDRCVRGETGAVAQPVGTASFSPSIGDAAP